MVINKKIFKIVSASFLVALTTWISLKPSVALATANSFFATTQAFQLEGESTADNIKLNWQLVDHAVKYNILRSDSMNGTYEVVGTRTGSIWDDYGIGTSTYWYKIEAVDSEGNVISTTDPISGTALVVDGNDFKVYHNTRANDLEIPSSIKVDETYYRYWAVRSDDGKSNISIVEFTSEDGINFDQGHVVLDHTDHEDLGNAKFEGTNAIYNAETGQVVIWAHWENGQDYSEAKAISVYGTPGQNDFITKGAFRPQGEESRDHDFYVNPETGEGWFISAAKMNSDLNIYKLSDDWTEILSEDEFPFVAVNRGEHREAPGMMYKDGWYYLFSSGAAGWYMTPGAYISSPSIEGLADAKIQVIGNLSTFGAQSNGPIPIGNNFYLTSYRWSGGWAYPDPVLEEQGAWSAMRLHPIALNNGYASYNYYPELQYDASTGVVIPVQTGKILSIDKPSGLEQFGDVPGRNGTKPENANNGISYLKDDIYEPITTSGRYTYTIDLETPSKISQVDLTFKQVNGSETISQYIIKGSKTGLGWTVLKDASDNRIPAFNEQFIDDDNEYRYIQLEVLDIVRANNINSSLNADWTRGIHEMVVYGQEGTPISDDDLMAFVEKPEFAVLAGDEALQSLPETLQVETFKGDIVDVPVTWKTENIKLNPFTSTSLVGVLEGNIEFEATVEVIKPNTVYYINSGTSNTGYRGFDLAKKLLGDQLLNPTSDYGFGGGNDGIREGSYNGDLFSGGYYGYNNRLDRPMTYVLPLSEGKYEITMGVSEWWTGPRTTELSVSENGNLTTIGQAVVSSSNRNATISGEFEVSKSGDVTFNITNPTGGDGQVVSWIAISQVD